MRKTIAALGSTIILAALVSCVGTPEPADEVVAVTVITGDASSADGSTEGLDALSAASDEVWDESLTGSGTEAVIDILDQQADDSLAEGGTDADSGASEAWN